MNILYTVICDIVLCHTKMQKSVLLQLFFIGLVNVYDQGAAVAEGKSDRPPTWRSIPSLTHLHAVVSLDKMLNPELLLIE